MADGIIAIKRGDTPVGEVRWTGTMGRGTWRFVPRATLPDAAQRALTDTVTGLPAAREELRGMFFTGPRGMRQAGWSGFAGLWGALDMVLPTVGLRIDRDASRWVRTLGPATHDDVLFPDATGAAASEAAADQWEILAIQARMRART